MVQGSPSEATKHLLNAQRQTSILSIMPKHTPKKPKKKQAKKIPKKQTQRRVAKKKTPVRKLSQQQIDFCLNIVQGLNQTDSFIKAGYSPKGARANASILIAKQNIQRELCRLRAKSEQSAVLSLQKVRECRAGIVNKEGASDQDKLTACRDDSKTMGWDKPQIIEVKGSLIDQIRQG